TTATQEALITISESAPADGKVGYRFSDLLAFAALEPLGPTFVSAFPASTCAMRVSALSLNAAHRALWVALRWLARRFISLALFVPRIGASIEHAFDSRARHPV